MIKFNMQRVPSTGTMNIVFSLDHLRVYANMFAFLEIMVPFLFYFKKRVLSLTLRTIGLFLASTD